MKKIFFINICIYCLIGTIHGENSYYYYHGERIPLTLSQDSVIVYSVNKKNTYSYTSYVAAKNNLNVRDISATSLERIIVSHEGTSIKMTNKFYVQLFDSSDIWKLQNIANETHTIIHGQVKNMPDWYVLIVHNSIIDNSLEMSNYFYETGLFKDIDPGFIFNYTSSCVTDSGFSDQWALPSLKACQAWNITKGNSQVKIAVVDNGIIKNHPEFLTSQFVDYYDCYTGSNISPYQVYGEHGTNVAGVIASRHNQEVLAGMAPNIKIMPINYNPIESSDISEDIANGISWAVAHGADVINCSWGDHHNSQLYAYLHSSLLESAIQEALVNGRNGKGCVVVFAAGNQGVSTLDYPAYVFPEILTVGAIENDYTRWEDSLGSSNYGDLLDVVAPGAHILTTKIKILSTESWYVYADGTSMAAPYVSSIAALMLSVNPYLTRKEVVDIIESTSLKVGNNVNYSYNTVQGHPNGKWDFEMGYGLVDAYAAVSKAQQVLFRGPDYICDTDTAKYYLLRPLQSGETVSWSVYNGTVPSPTYSIVGPTNQDTVLVKATYLNIRGDERILDISKYIEATITQGSNTSTYRKDFRLPEGSLPTVTVSNNSTLWPPMQSRTFTVTNCTNVPDSMLLWTIKKAIFPSGSGYIYTTTHRYGHSLTTIPLGAITNSSITITVTNLLMECADNSVSFTYTIGSLLGLNATADNEVLNVTIREENGDLRDLQTHLDTNKDYFLELWHSIYGCMCVQPAHSVNEQINTNGLPKGIYVVLLKKDGQIITETKVLIP